MVTVYSFVVDGAVDNIFVLVDTSVIGTLEVTMVTSEVGSKLVVGKAVVDAVYSFVVDDADETSVTVVTSEVDTR